MPIYEFKCSKCEEFFEVITSSASNASSDDNKCPKCGAAEFERVLSKTNYVMSNATSNGPSGVTKQERNCSQGSCSTYTIAGE
ncbi:MAG: zinc ribbon domain-containing protein [Desulfobacteraceae bacterium]|nr:zinc ribbon domain-containing protein [Desulfobacteraceae bacterium]